MFMNRKFSGFVVGLSDSRLKVPEVGIAEVKPSHLSQADFDPCFQDS